MMNSPDRRFPAYTIMGATILALIIISNLAADEFAGKPSEWERTVHAGDVEIMITTENMGNDQNDIIKFTDIIRNNFTMINNYDEKIIVNYTKKNYLGMKNILNDTNIEFELEKGENYKFSSHITMDTIGNNHIHHQFLIKNYSNPNQFLGWAINVDNLVVFSQEVYATAFIQELVIRFGWAIAIPFVIIATRHLVDIWDGK